MNNKELIIFYDRLLEKLACLEGILSVIGIYEDDQVNIDSAVEVAYKNIDFIRDSLESERDNLIQNRLCDIKN